MGRVASMVVGSDRAARHACKGGVALALCLALAACGGGGGVNSTPTPTPAPTPSPTPTPTPAPAPTPTPTSTSASQFYTSEYYRSDGPDFHGAVTAWQQGDTGKGVTIGIVDSGIDTSNPEFAGRILAASADVAGNRGIQGESSHGTDVALTAAAARNNQGVMGIAYDASLLVLRADTPGTCATQTASDPKSGCTFDDVDIAAGVNRAIANGAKVINLSLGGDPPSQVMTDAIAAAARAGIVVIVSAGNDGASTDPKIDPNNPDPFAMGLQAAGNGNVIIAGSVDKTSTISSFSNRAGTDANWFLAALGEDVCCEYENGVIKTTTKNGQSYVYVFSGTSFSAPQIAGAAALLFQAFPNLTATQVVDLLLRTARDAGAAGTDAIYGRGILDINAAFQPQGTTTVAGSTTAVALNAASGTTSPAMGDAAQTAASGGMRAVVLDSYDRAYSANLAGNLRAAAVTPRLAPALLGQMESVSGGNGKLALAFSVTRPGSLPGNAWSGQLRLSREDGVAAQVLAGRIVARLTPRTTVAFGFAQGADGLVAQVQGRAQPAFLVSGSPMDDTGFVKRDETSFAVRHQLGRWGLTVGAERANVATGSALDERLDPSSFNRKSGMTRLGLSFDRRWGALDASMGASWLAEDATVLGARFSPALGAHGADSLFLDAHAGWRPAPRLRLSAAYREGFTRPHVGGFVTGASQLTSNAWAFDVSREDLFKRGDALALRVSQPLRVTGGGLMFNLPVSYDYTTATATYGDRLLSLSPAGREIDTELAWRGPLWGGSAGMSLFYRKNPGHYAALPADKGAAASWSVKF